MEQHLLHACIPNAHTFDAELLYQPHIDKNYVAIDIVA